MEFVLCSKLVQITTMEAVAALEILAIVVILEIQVR
jgi:hypothetical protein